MPGYGNSRFFLRFFSLRMVNLHSGVAYLSLFYASNTPFKILNLLRLLSLNLISVHKIELYPSLLWFSGSALSFEPLAEELILSFWLKKK